MSSRVKPTLLKQISQVKFLLEAWRLLNTSNKKSTGLSKISIKDFEANLKNNIKSLSTSLLNGSFRFSAVKGVALAKKNKGFRPLMISEVQDRIVHKALALKLEAKLSRKYKIKNICSFAYQRKLSIQDAILKMASYYQQGYKYILEADIQSFFPTVDKQMLLNDICTNLQDHTLDILLQGSLNQELGNRTELKQRDQKIYDDIFSSAEEGIPQGNALSPLLANIFLANFDQRMIKSKIKMIRYADDFIILCKTADDAKKAYLIAIEELETKLSLTLYPLKDKAAGNEKISRILKPTEHSFSFLSVKFDGVKCSVSDKKVVAIISKLRDLSSQKSLKQNFPGQELGFLQVLVKVRNAVEGWIAAYSFLDIDNQIADLDKHVNITLYNIFNEFGFPLKKGSSDEIRTRKTLKTSGDASVFLDRNSNLKTGLNEKQRRSTGIPPCIETYKKSKPPMSFAERVNADISQIRTNKMATILN
ncbi:reverse transcriptase domain-containing protein [Mucilaginibacter lappiensis]|uniref:reverse transcriptase domain-containing protein n=1 Tax=Mucilaginibacter lappiensis TaxID=354630 RepID=UPI003D1AF6A1